jgi:putative colanic acid biosynthesis UDP-glucose lipid carrier transferase
VPITIARSALACVSTGAASAISRTTLRDFGTPLQRGRARRRRYPTPRPLPWHFGRCHLDVRYVSWSNLELWTVRGLEPQDRSMATKGRSAMIRSGSDAHSWQTPVKNFADTLLVVGECMIVADVMMGALLGYGSVAAYFRFASPAGLRPTMGGLIERELLLVSVVAALIIRGPGGPAMVLESRFSSVFLELLRRAAACVAILAAIGIATGTLQGMARLWLGMWGGGLFAWVCASRLLLLKCWQRVERSGATNTGIAIIGARNSGSRLLEKLRLSARVVEVVDTPSGDVTSMMDSLAGIISLARSGRVGLVVLADGDRLPYDTVAAIVQTLKAAPVQIAFCSEAAGAGGAAPALRMVAGVPLMLLVDRPLHPRDMLMKMLLDRFGAAILLVLAMPMLLAVAMTVMWDTPGPVIFRQARTGWCGRLFTVYKFRTMRHLPAPAERSQTVRSDPRYTQVGSFLRRTSLDELPQLWNVLLGDMSLVGPRPHDDALHGRERVLGGIVVEYAQRNRVKPGLTGWAQVNGLRGAADTPEKLRRRIEYDLYYIEHWSIWLDLKILVRTPMAVLSAENAF